MLDVAGLRIQRPPLTVRAVAVESRGLLTIRGRNMLSPIDVPPRVRVLAPLVTKAMSPVLLQMRLALFGPVPADAASLPKVPEDWIVALPASEKRRSVLTEGVWVVW